MTMRKLTLISMLLGGMLSMQAQINDLLISEYVEGSSNNKYLEIFNGTGTPITLTGQNYVVEVYANGSNFPTSSITLAGTIPAGDVFVLAHSSATVWSGTPDQSSGSLNYNGDDAVALRKNGQLLDLIGNIGCKPDLEWGTGLLSTHDNTIRRKPGACYGVTIDPPNNPCPFPTLTTDWDGFPLDEVSGLGFHTTSCTPVPTVGFLSATSSLNEGDSGTTNHPVAVTMDVAPIGNVTVLIVDAGTGSATPGMDYVFSPTTLTFTPSESYPATKMATVVIVGDTQAEPDETIDLDLSISSGTANPGLTSHTVAILNDDVPSTLYSQADGPWQSPNLWNTMPDGSGVYVTDPNNTQGPSGPEYHCIIQPGHDILLPATKGITTLTVQPGGSIKAGASSSRYLEIYGNAVIVNGVMGNGNTQDGLGLEFHSPNAMISGIGTIDLNRIRKNGFISTQLTIAHSLNLRYPGGGALFNDIANYPFDVTIQPGITVTVTHGDVSIDGVDGTNNSNRWGSINILGILDIQAGDLYLRTDNSTSGTQDIYYDIGPGGMVKIGGQLVGNQGVAGNAKAHLTIQSGAQLILTGAGEVMTAIDPVRDPISCHTNSLVDYAGTAAQLIEDEITYANLRSSMGGLKTLEGHTLVDGLLLLVNGLVRLDDYDLTIGPGGNAGGGSNASYAQSTGLGTLRQTVSSATRLFPVGNATYNPLTLTNTGTSDVFGARVFDEVRSEGLSGTPFTNLVVDRSWVVDESNAGGSQATLSVQWNANEELPGFDRSSCYLSLHTPTGWDGDTPSAASGSNPYYQLRAGLSEFGVFALGSGQALPVEWLSFQARLQDDTVHLDWSTATEANNDFFAIERSVNGSDYSEIGRIPGAGTTNEVSNYHFADSSPFTPHASLVFYRIRQQDFDGKTSYSPVRTIEIESPETALHLFPNPASDWMAIRLPEEKEKPSFVQLRDERGRTVKTFVIPAGIREWSGSLGSLAPGKYLVEVEGSRRWVVVF